MATSGDTPLTDFLIEVVNDPEKLALFTGTAQEREELLGRYMLGEDHLRAIRSENIRAIQELLVAEMAAERDSTVAYWATSPLKRPINT